MAMPSQAPGEDAAAAFYEQRRIELLRDELVTEKRMFGTTALCAQGKVFMFPWRQNLVFKLPAHRVAELIAANSGELFDPGHGRTSPSWVAVYPSAHEAWPALADAAHDFVQGRRPGDQPRPA